MKVDGLLRVAVLGMMAALVLMLVTLVWPTPHTMGSSWAPALALAAAALAALALRVYRDLRARRLL